MLLTRRRLLTGLLAAPIIVRPGLLMKIAPTRMTRMVRIDWFGPEIGMYETVRFVETSVADVREFRRAMLRSAVKPDRFGNYVMIGGPSLSRELLRGELPWGEEAPG